MKNLYKIKSSKAKLNFYLVYNMKLNSYIGKLQYSYKNYAYFFGDGLIDYLCMSYKYKSMPAFSFIWLNEKEKQSFICQI